jgi:hypothetical protein
MVTEFFEGQMWLCFFGMGYGGANYTYKMDDMSKGVANILWPAKKI